MPKFHRHWTVFPHGPVKQIDDGILSVEGEIRMPLGRFPRRMTAVRLASGEAAVFSPVALDDAGMQRIEQLGRPAFMIVPNGFHRLDSRIWKERYPAIQVICPPGARARVEEAVSVDATSNIFEDGAVSFVMVDGTEERESALIVRRKAGTTVVVNDMISNIRHPKGLGANIMARLFGFGVKRPQMAREVRYLLVKDKGAAAAQLRSWADIPDLRRIIVSHGEIIERDPAEILRSIASTLD